MATKPRILYMCGWPIGAKGQGSISFVYEQIEALSDSIDPIFLDFEFVSNLLWPFYKIANMETRTIDHLWDIERVQSLLWRVPKVSTRISGNSVLTDVRLASEIIADKITKKLGKIDIIHAHVVLPAGLMASIIAEKLQVPLLLQEHSAPFEMHLNTEEKQKAVDEVLLAANEIIAVGPDLEQKLIGRIPGKKIHVIPEMVNTHFFPSKPMQIVPGEINLISVGGLVERKGYSNLIKAIALLNEKNRETRFRLTIIGEGPARENLEGLIDSFHLNEQVTLKGHLSREDVKKEIGRANIYVHSSLKETFGIAPAEALSVGRPVVTTKCGGPEFYINEELGVIVEKSDPELLYHGILAVKNKIESYDPSTLHQRMNDLFGPETFVRKVSDLYKNLMNYDWQE